MVLIDFTDMIQKFLDTKDTPEFDVIFVDEAQDLIINTMGYDK